MTLGIIGEKDLQSLSTQRLASFEYYYMQTLAESYNCNEVELCHFFLTVMLVEIVNGLIDSLYHCCFLIEVKEVSKQQIMCDYDDAVLT